MRSPTAACSSGIYTTKYLPTVEEPDNPWTQLFTKVWEEHGDGKPMSNFRLYGMAQAYTLVSALQAAGEDLTRDGIVDAHRGAGRRVRGPVARAARLLRGQPPRHHRRLGRPDRGHGVKELVPVATTDGGDGAIEPYEEEPFAPTEDGLPAVG